MTNSLLHLPKLLRERDANYWREYTWDPTATPRICRLNNQAFGTDPIPKPIPVLRYEPGERTPQANEAMRSIGTILDIELDDKTLGVIREQIGPGFGAYASRTGWSHHVISEAFAQNCCWLGEPAVRMDMREASEMINPIVGLSNTLKEMAHGAVQRGENIEDALNTVLHSYGIDGGMNRHVVQKILTKMAFQLANIDKLQLADDECYLERAVFEKLYRYPELMSLIAGAFGTINQQIFNAPIAETVRTISEDILGARVVYSSLPGPVKMDRAVTSVVDPGFSLALETFDSNGHPADPHMNPDGYSLGGAVEFIAGSRNQPQVVPDRHSRHIQQTFFDRPKTFDGGENFGPIDQERFFEKWLDTKKQRNVLLATSGNRSSLGEIENGVDDFITYQKAHQDSPYTCFVFIGDHIHAGKDEQIGVLIEKIRESGCLEYVAGPDTNIDLFMNAVGSSENKGKMILIGTDDIFQTAIIKLKLEEIAHVEGVKAGEAPSMNPQKMTATVLYKPAPPNEQVNGVYALMRGGSIAHASVWLKYAEMYLSRLGYEGKDLEDKLREIPGLERLIKTERGLERIQEENVFDMLDHYFGDRSIDGNLEREVQANRMRQITCEGLLNFRNSSIPTMALMIAQALEMDLGGAKIEEVQQQIDAFHMMDRSQKFDLIRKYFPSDVDVLRPLFSEEIRYKKAGVTISMMGVLVGGFIAAAIAGRQIARRNYSAHISS